MTQRKRKIWRRVWVAWLGFLALLLFLTFSKRGFLQQLRLKYRKQKLVKEIEMLQEDNKLLTAEKDTLNDPHVIERIARERYGMAKKDEKVYRVVPREK